MVNTDSETEPQNGNSNPAAPNQMEDKRGTRVKKLEVRDLSVHYSGQTVLSEVTLDVWENEIFGIIGPANAGKTSFLKCINLMNTFTDNMGVGGRIRFNGMDIHQLKNVYALRSRIGVVFPLPVGLPLTIYENVALSPGSRESRTKRN